MKISLKWLKELIDTKLSENELIEKLTDLGLECSLSDIGPSFKGVVVGRVKKVEKHSNSDHLSLCQVDIGEKPFLQIVCGAPNVREGIYVPVAIVGSSLGNGDFKIKKTKIRGENSEGMICSEKELDLGSSHKGIMVLDKKSKLGASFKDFLNLEKDAIIDFDLTPNRGDCLSFLGIAREVAILESKCHQSLMEKVITENTFNIIENDDSIDDNITVDIEDKESCPLYLGKIIKGIQIKETPKWLKRKLDSLGMKSINLVVDLANYVMLTFGQPMHTFDFDKLPTKKIQIGYPGKNKILQTLDGVNRKLYSNNLLIKDGKTPIAIAGVIGGKNTEVDNDTKNIFIESALFNSTSIRKSAKSIDISTDASKRFERSVDPLMANIAVNILSGLIIKHGGGKACKGTVKTGKEPVNNYGIQFSINDCNDFLGTSLTEKEIELTLDKVNIDYTKKKNLYICLPPYYRIEDIQRDVDIYEEIARVVGFNNIEQSSSFSIDYSMINFNNFNLVDFIKNVLSRNGFFEHYSNSLISEEEHNYFSDNSGIKLSNPLNRNMRYIRNSILPGLIKAVSFNQNRKIKNYKLFEVGAIYESLDINPPIEDICLGVVWPAIKFDHWKDNIEYDFFNSKRDVDFLLDQLNISNHEYLEIRKKGFSVCYSIKSNNLEIGYIGLTDSKVLDFSNIKSHLICAEISTNKLDKVLIRDKNFKEPSIYPYIERDISVLVSDEYPSKKLTDTIKKAGGKFLNEVYLFDVYADNSFNKDMKSYAFKMIFQSNTDTLKDSDVDILIDKILNKLKHNYNIIQR